MFLIVIELYNEYTKLQCGIMDVFYTNQFQFSKLNVPHGWSNSLAISPNLFAEINGKCIGTA